MPLYELKDIPEEFVTPKHSSAFGRLITGEQIELGLLRYKAGEGATEHSHPQEQIILLLKGKARATLGKQSFDVGPSQAVLIPSGIPHSLTVLEDAEVVSLKSLVAGVGHKI